MTLRSVSDRDDLGDFLDFLYSNQEGYVYVATKEAEGTFTQEFFPWPTGRDEIKRALIGAAGNKDVYVAPALFSEPTNSQKANVKGSHVVWAEFDGTAPDSGALGDVPAPSLVVRSSEEGHEHWYWNLGEFISDTKFIERVNRGLTYQLGADTSGWDSNQILRPPGTFNHKRSKPVVLVSYGPFTVDKNTFAGIPEPPQLATEYSRDDILDTLTIIAKYSWDNSHFKMFRQSTVPVGERSTRMMNLGYICAEMGMSNQEIFSVLYSADERWGKFKGRSDQIRRLNDIVAKVRIKHPESSINVVINELPLFGLNSFLQTEVNVEWAIPNLLEKSGSMLLSSKPGLGKTQLSLRFAMYLALGRKFLRYDIPEPSRVVFFSFEMGHAQLKYFLSQMSASLSDSELSLLERNLTVVPLGESLYLDKEEGRRLFEDVIRRVEPDGYFLDSLTKISTSSTSDEEIIKDVLEYDQRIRQRYNAFSWIVHHNRKPSANHRKPTELEDAVGSYVIGATATVSFTMWPYSKTDFNQIELINTKNRMAPREKSYVIKRTSDLNFLEASVVGGEVPVADEITAQAIPEQRDDNGEDGPQDKFQAGLDF